MSSEPTASDASPSPDVRPTEISARGRADPWAVADADVTSLPATALAPRQFDPTCHRRLRNLVDEANDYSPHSEPAARD